MRICFSTLTFLAAITVANAQTSQLSFFYPGDQTSYDEYENIALSVIEVQDADHTIVAFSCMSSTTSASLSQSTGTRYDDDDDDYDDDSYYNSCIFADDALTATVGPDSFAYTTSYNQYYIDYDYTVIMGCTSAAEAALCTFQSDGADAWSDYCSYTASIDTDDENAVTSCISSHTVSVLPAYTSALQLSDISTLALPVTAGADKLSAGATATGSASASSTSHVSKFTVSSLPTGGATTTIGGPATSSSTGATSAQQTNANAAAGRASGAGKVGIMGVVVAAALQL